MKSKKYRQEIWEEAISKAAKRYDTKQDTIKIIYSILLVLFVALILVSLKIWDKNQSIPYFIWGLFSADIIAIIAMRVAIPISAYLDMWNTAADRDEDQRKKINEFSSYNNKILIENFDYYDAENPSEYKVGIVIQNKNSVPFTEVSIELIETNWEKQDSLGNIYLEERIGTLADNSHFRNWANGTKNSVNARDKETIYFYQVEDSVVALLEKRKYTFNQEVLQNEWEAISFIETIFEVRGKVANEFFEKRYKQRIKYMTSKLKPEPGDILRVLGTSNTHSIVVCEGDIIEITN